MKIGILTFHKGFNCGAFLQAYSLYLTLSKLGAAVKIVDYEPASVRYTEYQFILKTKNPFTFFGNIKKVVRFRSAWAKLVKSRRTDSLPRIQSEEQFDAFVFGSDEIWNFRNPVSGFDPAYFGNDLDGIKKVSYAPSFGNIEIGNNLPEPIVKNLKDFSAISARDKNTQVIVEKATTRESTLVLDPTFLVDFPSKSPTSVRKDYVLVYVTSLSKELAEKINIFARANKLDVISICYKTRGIKQNILGVGPFEFVDFFASASYIVTNTLHGTIFSIKNRKKFALVEDSYRKNKLGSIIDIFQLASRLIDSSGKGLEAVLNTNLDLEEIDDLVEKHRATSLNYLKVSLGL